MAHGELAGAPIQGVRVQLVDGSYHSVDSSEMAFKVAGSMAFKAAYEKAQPTLLEPIMELEVTVPDEAVGAVNGDLNSRRGRLLGMEPTSGMTTIRAEVPMAEVLTYSQSLTSMTGGRGDYHMAVPPLRGGADAHRAEADRGGEEGEGGRPGLSAAPEQGFRGRCRPPALANLGRCVSRASSVERRCAICERTLLMGERAGALLAERRRATTSTSARSARRRRSRTAGSRRARRRRRRSRPSGGARASRSPACSASRRAPAEEPVATRADPAAALRARARDRRGGRPLQRVAVPAHVGGIAKSLGEPRVSIVPLSGVNPDVVVTVAWEISWYQYRVTADSAQPVRLAERGHELGELEGSFTRVERAHGGRRPHRPGHRASSDLGSYTETVIYCVVPPELEEELYDEARRLLRGQPGRRGDHRPPHGPDRRHGRRRRRGRAEARDARPPPRARIPGRSPTPTSPAA